MDRHTNRTGSRSRCFSDRAIVFSSRGICAPLIITKKTCTVDSTERNKKGETTDE